MARIGLNIPITVDSKGVDKGTAEASRRLNKFQHDVKHTSLDIGKHALGIAAGFTSVAGAAKVLEDSASSVEAIAKGADAFARMANGPQKAALAQQLFGRQAKTLLPILNGGSKALEEQLSSVKRYGAALDDSGIAKTKEAIEAQHHFDLAMEGVK